MSPDLLSAAITHDQTLARALETPPGFAGAFVEAAAFRVALCEQALAEARLGLDRLLLGLAARNFADHPANNL
jgi:hypothetical protein